jgi:hypothetical protein
MTNRFPNWSLCWGFCSLATKIASVLGGAVVAMENYHDPSLSVDDSSDFDTIDFMLLVRNLEVLFSSRAVMQTIRRYLMLLLSALNKLHDYKRRLLDVDVRLH